MGVPLTYLDGLQERTVETLRPLMQALSIPKPRPTRKADIVRAIAERMEDDALLRDIWAQLDGQEQMVVRETVYDGGWLNVARFVAKHGALPPGLARRTGYGAGNSPAASSAMQLLFVPAYREGPLNCVPADLAARLRELAAPPPPVALRTTDELPESVAIHVPGGARKPTTEAALTVRQMERAAVADPAGGLALGE